ncbi:unnamed protein product [Eruca vesicaria subsp. sativa]|uniref:Ubiquitin-like protease family profile domain-containing protein n=1 Tax=Eruca vesicaria subsp. sativa TaxID=29727 RepID=A0ABC8JA32_ERUVS|nr:unnamed protein product [Eruca vesicaria subsp. sativa]
MDATTYIWREKITLRRWKPYRVSFMPAYFFLQIQKAYLLFMGNKRSYELAEILLAYGRGELPPHGWTNKIWGVDVDLLYFPQFFNTMFSAKNHWVSVCVNIIEKAIEVFDSSTGRNMQYLEKLGVMIPRIE